MSQCCNKFIFDDTPDTFQMWQGLRGPYFTPHVAENGDLSWSNNGQLPNPETVNIKGPPGPGGVPGGTTGQLLAKASDENYDTEWIDPPDLDAGHVEYDPAETYDDGSVGKELTTINSALTSLQSVTEIIDTASGAIASFPDGSGLPMRSLVAQINPVQDLHGQSSPYPAGGSKNKLNPESWVLRTTNGITFTRDGNDIVCNGTATATAYLNLTQFTYTASVAFNRIQIYATSSATVSGVTIQIQRKSGSSTIGTLNLAITGATNETGGNIDSTTTQEIAGYIAVSNGVTLNNVHLGIAVYFDDSSATTHAYYPYSNLCPISGHTGLSGWVEDEYDPTEQPTFSVNWQDTAGTVYGGQDEIVGGELASEWTKLKLLSTFGWQESGTAGSDRRFGFQYISNPSIVKAANQNGTFISNVLAPYNIGYNSHDFGAFYISNSWLVVHDKNSHFATLADFKAWLDSEDVYLVYKVATPQTYQLTPQEVDTLLGQNNVWHDANGDTTVTYQASIKGYIDKVLGQ